MSCGGFQIYSPQGRCSRPLGAREHLIKLDHHLCQGSPHANFGPFLTIFVGVIQPGSQKCGSILTLCQIFAYFLAILWTPDCGNQLWHNWGPQLSAVASTGGHYILQWHPDGVSNNCSGRRPTWVHWVLAPSGPWGQWFPLWRPPRAN